MTKYLVKIPYDRTIHDHWRAQAVHMGKFLTAGLEYHMFQWVSGTHASGVDYHSWKIECTEEQLSYLVMSCGAKMEFNLTEQARNSGMKKLNQDEIDALGLTKWVN